MALYEWWKSKCSFSNKINCGQRMGQGPQHSQSLETIFAHIPGLKVVAPTNPDNTYWLLKESIKDKNPVIFLNIVGYTALLEI